MKKLLCKNEGCGNRRVHHDMPDKPRGAVSVEVDDDYPEDGAVFCSYTCALLDGWTSLRYETSEEIEVRQNNWHKKQAERKKKKVLEGLKKLSELTQEFDGYDKEQGQ
jgi:hypothetical protein